MSKTKENKNGKKDKKNKNKRIRVCLVFSFVQIRIRIHNFTPSLPYLLKKLHRWQPWESRAGQSLHEPWYSRKTSYIPHSASKSRVGRTKEVCNCIIETSETPPVTPSSTSDHTERTPGLDTNLSNMVAKRQCAIPSHSQILVSCLTYMQNNMRAVIGCKSWNVIELIVIAATHAHLPRFWNLYVTTLVRTSARV